MSKQSGFTLIELIFTLVITAILAGIVIEIIAGPIRSYFWVTQQALRVETAEQALDNISKELLLALPQTIQVENEKTIQSLTFKKILNKGLIVSDPKPTPYFVLSEPIRYQCTNQTKMLERIEESSKALLANQMQHCQFTLIQNSDTNQKNQKMIFISLQIGSKGEKPLEMTQPLLLEDPL